MLHISRRARLLSTLLALVLLLPVAGMGLHTKKQLEEFHKRRLRAAPAAAALLADPVGYFRDARAWLGERVYPIRKAVNWRRRLLLDVFHTAPQRNVALGRDGFVFITGVDEVNPYNILQNACIDAHGADAGKALQRSLAQLAEYGQRRGIAVDVVVVPTLLTLYPDQLPAALPQHYRDACAARARGESALLQVQAPAGVHYSFAYSRLYAARADAAMFPQADWHATGLSAKLVRDDYLAQLQLAPPAQEWLEHSSKPSEILQMHGLTASRPVWLLRNDAVSADADANAAFNTAVAPLVANPYPITAVWTNRAAPRPENVLMVSDSYGQLTAPVFAAAFRSVAQLTANELANDQVAELVERTDRLRGVDRLILLVHDGGIYRVFAWARALQLSTMDRQPAPSP